MFELQADGVFLPVICSSKTLWLKKNVNFLTIEFLLIKRKTLFPNALWKSASVFVICMLQRDLKITHFEKRRFYIRVC